VDVHKACEIIPNTSEPEFKLMHVIKD